jgi:hypothetical protein
MGGLFHINPLTAASASLGSGRKGSNPKVAKKSLKGNEAHFSVAPFFSYTEGHRGCTESHRVK